MKEAKALQKISLVEARRFGAPNPSLNRHIIKIYYISSVQICTVLRTIHYSLFFVTTLIAIQQNLSHNNELINFPIRVLCNFLSASHHQNYILFVYNYLDIMLQTFWTSAFMNSMTQSTHIVPCSFSWSFNIYKLNHYCSIGLDFLLLSTHT